MAYKYFPVGAVCEASEGPGIDYVTGKEITRHLSDCYKINTDGKCPNYEAKEPKNAS
jgi:hypothetical protein